MKRPIKSIVTFLILSVILYISCTKEEGFNQENITVIINKNKPKATSLSLEFKEDLCIKENWALPTKLLVDTKGNIFVFDEEDKKPTIYRFDEAGNLLLKKSFDRGQGPGDFNFMDPHLSSEGKLNLFDKQARRLTVLNSMLEVEKTIKFEKSLFNFKLDSKGYIYGFCLGFTETMTEYLAKFSPDGKYLSKVFEFEYINIERKEDANYVYLYNTLGKYKIDRNDNLYYVRNDKYEINIINPEGKLIKKIVIKTRPIKINEDDIERTRKRLHSNVQGGRYRWVFTSLAENKPYIDDFFVLENGFLLVLTYEFDDGKDESILADLFDEKGYFLKAVEVPSYYKYHSSRTDYYYEKAKVLKNNYFYTIEADEEEENFYVKRYKLIWEY